MDSRYRELGRIQAELQIMRYSLGAGISEVKSQWLDYVLGIEQLLMSEDIHVMCLYAGGPFKDSHGYYIQLNIGRLGESKVQVYCNKLTSKDGYSLWCPINTHTSLQDLVTHLKGIGSRRQLWLSRQAALKRCTTCYYGGAYPYCGLGMPMIEGCGHHYTEVAQ